jgi:hypothetical protein
MLIFPKKADIPPLSEVRMPENPEKLSFRIIPWLLKMSIGTFALLVVFCMIVMFSILGLATGMIPVTAKGRTRLEEQRKLNQEYNKKIRIQYGKDLGNNLEYFKDERSHLCFVRDRTSGGLTNPRPFTMVPCTKEVEELILLGVTQ